jgi:hypothetical protein
VLRQTISSARRPLIAMLAETDGLTDAGSLSPFFKIDAGSENSNRPDSHDKAHCPVVLAILGFLVLFIANLPDGGWGEVIYNYTKLMQSLDFRNVASLYYFNCFAGPIFGSFYGVCP